MPLELTFGNIVFKASAAASALGLPPSKQSLNVNNDCRTGLEYETALLSTNVTFLIPHAYPSKMCFTILFGTTVWNYSPNNKHN
jgi:hypothetical protein